MLCRSNGVRYKDPCSDGIFIIIRGLTFVDSIILLNDGIFDYSFNGNFFHTRSSKLPSTVEAAYFIRADMDLCLNPFIFCNKRSISSKDEGDVKYSTNQTSHAALQLNSTSLSSISKLGIKTYKNSLKYRELIRKDNNGKVGVYC